MEKQTVDIHGKAYETVASRLNRFIKENPRYCLSSTMTPNGEGVYFTVKITVFDDQYRVVKEASGHSYERKDSSMINKTSHVENAETSAVGRALAFLGYAGTEIASADEVATAILNQGKAEQPYKSWGEEQAELDDSDIDQTQAGEYLMPMGKFKGLTLSKIAEQMEGSRSKGIEYLEWFNSNPSDKKNVRDCQANISAFLKSLAQQ